jgi:hypothetical protein
MGHCWFYAKKCGPKRFNRREASRIVESLCRSRAAPKANSAGLYLPQLDGMIAQPENHGGAQPFAGDEARRARRAPVEDSRRPTIPVEIVDIAICICSYGTTTTSEGWAASLTFFLDVGTA